MIEKIIKDLADRLCFNENQVGYTFIKHAIEKAVKVGKQSPNLPDKELTYTGEFEDGWNACLDKIEKLNNPNFVKRI